MTQNIYGRVEAVLEDLRRTISDERAGTHGDPELFVKVFSGMVREYIHGVLQTERGLQDLDGFVLLSLMKIARQSVGGPVPFYDHSLDAAGYQVLKAAAIRPDAIEPGDPQNLNGVEAPQGSAINMNALQAELETGVQTTVPDDVQARLDAMTERTRALRARRTDDDPVG